jgi:hypothetical protein
MIVLHLEMPALIVIKALVDQIMRRIDIELALKDVRRRVCGVDVGN